jgi:hypothetical protein
MVSATKFSPLHVAAITRGDIKAKQILVKWQDNTTMSATEGLTESQLLKKARIALQAMDNTQ